MHLIATQSIGQHLFIVGVIMLLVTAKSIGSVEDFVLWAKLEDFWTAQALVRGAVILVFLGAFMSVLYCH